MPLANSCTLYDPLVVGFDHLGQVIIRQHARRNKTAERAEFCTWQIISSFGQSPKFLVLHSGLMQVEAALFFETTEELYARVFRHLKPRTPLPEIRIQFKRYANADSRVALMDGILRVQISDMLQGAPAPVQEALAVILLGKLYRKQPDSKALAVYRRYLNRADVRRTLHLVKQERGRKLCRDPHKLISTWAAFLMI